MILRDRLALLSNSEKTLQSQFLCEQIASAPVFRASNSILFYAATANEPDLFPLMQQAIAAGKKVYLPAIEQLQVGPVKPGSRLVPARYGMAEPAKEDLLDKLPEIDLVLLPGLAFDGVYRLGHGSGWYDRLYQALKTRSGGDKCVFAGVGFKEHLLAWLPSDPWDLKCELVFIPG